MKVHEMWLGSGGFGVHGESQDGQGRGGGVEWGGKREGFFFYLAIHLMSGIRIGAPTKFGSDTAGLI